MRLTLIIALLLPLLASCPSDGGPACEDNGDCEGGQICAYLHSSNRSACSTQCASDAGCGTYETCSGSASSCPDCLDLFLVCE